MALITHRQVIGEDIPRFLRSCFHPSRIEANGFALTLISPSINIHSHRSVLLSRLASPVVSRPPRRHFISLYLPLVPQRHAMQCNVLAIADLESFYAIRLLDGCSTDRATNYYCMYLQFDMWKVRAMRCDVVGAAQSQAFVLFHCRCSVYAF